MTGFEKKYLDLAKRIVLKHIPKDDYAVFLFGSRADGNASKFADLDIGIWGENEISGKIISALKDDLSNSDVPYDYDVIDFSRVSEGFKQLALKKIELWNHPKNFKKNFRILQDQLRG